MEEQIRYVFETNNIGVKDGNLNVDDVIETANHFRLVSLIIDNAKYVLTEEFIEGLHLLLKMEQVIQDENGLWSETKKLTLWS